MAGKDPSFKINDFNEPKILSPLETYVNNVMMLLFGKKGFYPSIPDLGMDIQQYLYKFEDEINTDEIKTELANQCSDFLPEIDSGDLDVMLTRYKERTTLLFVLPVIDDISRYSVVLGISTNSRGEMIYNFVENKYQIL